MTLYTVIEEKWMVILIDNEIELMSVIQLWSFVTLPQVFCECLCSFHEIQQKKNESSLIKYNLKILELNINWVYSIFTQGPSKRLGQ